MLKKILIGFGILIVVFLIVVALQPSEYRVVRSATIASPPAAVFDQVNDFHNWEAWSPWEERDPTARATFEGPPSGTGAIFTWAGNEEVGEGRMTITESRPHELILIKLDFLKPFESTAMTEFTFVPEGDQTSVAWSMTGQNNFVSKAICLFMDMDKMIGGDFEAGLAKMKSVVESAQHSPVEGGSNRNPPRDL